MFLQRLIFAPIGNFYIANMTDIFHDHQEHNRKTAYYN